jgi:hypothetical protein
MFHHRCGHDKHPHPCGHINSSKTTHFLLSSFLPFYQTRTVSYMTGISINWSRNSLPVRNTRVHSRFSIVLVSLFVLLLLCSYVLLLACVCPFSFAIWSSLHWGIDMTTRVWMFVMSTSVVEHIISQCPDSSIVGIKTKNSDGQQFHQYHQNKRKFKQWWSTIPSISSKQKKV